MSNAQDIRQYLTFEVKQQRLGVEILKVKEIIEHGSITLVPMMQACISGVINLRGSVVPVIDLSSRFGQGQTSVHRRTCIVVIESQALAGSHVIGFMVDAVNAVVDVANVDVNPPPQFGAGINTDFLKGVGKVAGEFVLLLNVERLMDFSIDNPTHTEGQPFVETV
ncbi:MAG TPA: chemotaxis protein CheW [Limnobacter sp.]|nr:chemotaxis protein CheW [Limnobacter sp.]